MDLQSNNHKLLAVWVVSHGRFRRTQRQFSENNCSEDDLRSRICCKISCLPASAGIFEHLENGIYNCPCLTDFYPKKVT